ncbi:GTP 3',8-cyclase MoaA [Vulgatibacter sp.]|uniref:GTP 3',8-cyclase MoaA n=1 Tax=Vulgatibacter sp. TaxID=1971226 RepID=UPI0035686717
MKVTAPQPLVPLRHAANDRRGRPLRDLRISVTDRCNFRCPYCMPAEAFGPGHRFLGGEELLSFDEIEAIARAAVALGVEKIRLTGGEPLLRPGIEELVERIAGIPGVRDLALTTNGSRLAPRAAALARAGLRRVTVSLDALDDETFARMSGVGARVAPVLEGIAAARAAGLGPVKVNMVVRRGVNDHAIEAMARHFHGTGDVLRFIEYMDVGSCNRWNRDEVVSGEAIVRKVHAVLPLEPLDPAAPGEVARRYRYRDGGGEIGVITSVTRPFCGGCVRARLAADGTLYTCLFATDGHDLRRPLREGAGAEALLERLRTIWSGRDDRYSELRELLPVVSGKVEMSRVGG